MRSGLALAVVASSALVGARPGFCAPDPQPVTLRGGRVAVEARVQGGRLLERYLALRDGGWIEVASGDRGETLGPVSVVVSDGETLPGSLVRLRLQRGALVEEMAAGPHRVVRTLRVVGDGPWIHVVTRLEPSGRASLLELTDRLRFSRVPDWSYSPSVGGFNPDAQYKAPLILLQADRAAVGIVPDLGVLRREDLERCRHALDLDVPGGATLAVGFVPARRVSHSVYSPDRSRPWSADAPVENAYYVMAVASAPPAEAYRQAVRFHWERFGRAEQAHAADQQAGTDPAFRALALWDDWRKVVWEEESPRLWLPVTLPDGSVGGGVRTQRWGPGPSVYLSSWFNTLRTSYGMALFARRARNGALLDLARQTVALATRAPGRDGAFKCIAVPTEGGTIWAAGDGAGESTRDGFLGYDMCWTGYWLLKWRAAGLPGSEDVLPRCRQLAKFVLDRQAPDGMLPTRFGEDGAVQEDLSRTVKAETGPVVLFLLELYAQEPDPRYLDGARKGLAFLEGDVIPLRQWYDYETFWSCSPRKPALDERTRQWPANDLALGQAVAAYLRAFQLTGERRHLDTGGRLLDYLLLYQQCWTHPGLEDLGSTAMLLGGFTTQNSDAEWSDARQSQIGNVLLDYYRATGRVEYLERGVAALRAQFPVSPSENWAHEGYGKKAGVSSFHWGTGSGMAGIEIEEDFLRDAAVDLRAARGVGVNGLNVTGCAVRDGTIRLRLASPFPWRREPVVAFHGADPAQQYRLVVNGSPIGSWRGAEMQKGVPVPAPSGPPR